MCTLCIHDRCAIQAGRSRKYWKEFSMIQEFKDFINKGGVFETAVGLIMALAFAPVVQGLVDNIIMPIVARIFGKPDFSDVRISLGGSYDITDEAGNVIGQGPAYMEVGTWITTIIGFILLSIVIFLLVKAYNKSKPPEPEEVEGPTEVELLTEIRDSLATR